MPTSTVRETSSPTIHADLQHLSELPEWLVAAADPARLIAGLTQQVAEFASGELTVQKAELDRLRLKDEQWHALYELTIDGPGDERDREVIVRGILTRPGTPIAGENSAGAAFGTPQWSCVVPDLNLALWMYFSDESLEAMPIMTDADEARAFLEASIHACSPNYADLAIASIAPKVMRYKPGSRCTVLYRVGYEGENAARWPDIMVAKTYSRDKGPNAYEAMSKLWASPLSKGDIVSIAEPLAYSPEHKILVQGPVYGDISYKDLLRSAIRDGSPAALDELYDITRKTAAGLAALHQSGARHGETVTWDDELDEIRGEITKLSAADPGVVDATAGLFALLEARSVATPAEPTLPAHRSFRPQQVQIHNGAVGFIDFDGFCLAEPALDIALFRASLKEMGINTSPSKKQKEFVYADDAARQARMDLLDKICDTFLDEYASHAPISRERVALWEALDLLTVVLRCWSKVKPHQLANAMFMLESQLSASGLLSA